MAFFRLTSILLGLCLSLLAIDLQAQTTLWTEDFEDHGNTANGGAGRYTSTGDFVGGGNDFFARVHNTGVGTGDIYITNMDSGTNIGVGNIYAGQNGDYYYAGEDLDDNDGDGNIFKNLTISGINITGASSLTFKGLFAAGRIDGCGANQYDAPDGLTVYYTIDAGAEVEGMCFNAAVTCPGGNNNNEPFHHDPNCDNDGTEGTALNNNFQEFTFSIPTTGTSLSIRVEAVFNSGNEEFAFDYLRVEGVVQEIANNDADGDGTPDIADPCSCTDPMNPPATVMGPGGDEVFHELVTVTSGAGETWEMDATTTGALDATGAALALPAAMTEGPAGVYTLSFYHERGVGYNGDFSNGTSTLSIANTCTAACSAVPTLSEWGLILFSLLMLNMAALFVVKAKRKEASFA